MRYLTPKELAAYARVMRKHGVATISLGANSITLDLSHEPAEKNTSLQPTKQSQLTDSPTPETDSIDEESVLFWSAGA